MLHCGDAAQSFDASVGKEFDSTFECLAVDAQAHRSRVARMPVGDEGRKRAKKSSVAIPVMSHTAADRLAGSRCRCGWMRPIAALPKDADIPSTRTHEAKHDAQRGRLARAVRSQISEDFAGLNAKTDAP